MPQIKVLAIFGSPRKGGNTDTLLEAALECLVATWPESTVERIRICEFDISPCTSCGDCDADGACTVEDDMRDIYERLEEADILMVSSPVYFMGPTAWLKTIVDRCQGVWIKNFVLRPGAFKEDMKERPRVAGLISACGQEGERMFQGLDNTMFAWFSTLGFHYDTKLLVERMDRSDAVQRDPKVLDQARELGRALVEELERRRKWYKH